MKYALAAAVIALLSPGQVQTTLKNKAGVVPIAPRLEVREFTGDFTQWRSQAAIGAGALQKEFRWSAAAKPSAARYEVGVYPFPNLSTYQPITLIANSGVPVPAPGGTASFTINFAPALQQMFGTSAPPEHARFYVRVVPLDANQKPLSPVSNTATVDYMPPAPGTSLDQSMVLRLKSARCVRQTSGPGSDDIQITIIGAAISNQGHAKYLFEFGQDGIPDSWSIAPSHPLWTYTGLGFKPNVHIVAAVVEDDSSAGMFTVKGVSNAGNATDQLVAQFGQQTCHDGDSCLGGPKVLSVTAADWHKVALGGQTVSKRLRFAGDGGLYELIFELAPK